MNEAYCPNPGIYPGVSFETYCRWDAINHSRLSRMDKSPLHAMVAHDFSGSSSIRLGQLVHAGRLEPESVAKRYAIMPAFEKTELNKTKDGKRTESTNTDYVKKARVAFERQSLEDGKVVVSASEYNDYLLALNAIASNAEVVAMVNAGECELSIVWVDESTGLTCKARIDCKTQHRLMDLKTARDDSERPLADTFGQSLWNYSYYSQGAFYQEGWRVLTGEYLDFWFAVVGTTQPMQCIAAPLGELSLQLGRKKNAERLFNYATCKSKGVFPGYSSPMVFELPERYFPDEVAV